MSKIIHCEWKSEQPDFFKKVELDGVELGTIHALTKSDWSYISRHSNDLKDVFNGTIWTIFRSLIGHEETGWNFDKDVTYDNINDLPDKYFNAFAKAVNDFKEQNEITDGIEKN